MPSRLPTASYGLHFTSARFPQQADPNRKPWSQTSDDDKNEGQHGREGHQDFEERHPGNGHGAVYGTPGDDRLEGGPGNDWLYGRAGNDGLVGGPGNDHLFGGPGRDFLVGGPGRDTLTGGPDSDTFVFRLGTGVDTVADLSGDDRLDLRDFGFASHQAALDAFRQVGRNAVLDLGHGDKVILENTNIGQLSAAQFVTSWTETGPSSSQSPYLVPVDADPTTSKIDTHTSFTSLLTTGDQVGVKDDGVTPWRMAGTPDGLGAFDNGDGTFTVLMNHEFTPTAGAVRDHGATGSFISELVIDKTTLKVLEAKDLIEDVHLYNASTHSYVEGTTAFNRFCSADLAGETAFYNPETGLGYQGGRIFLNGEESGTEGRAFAHFATGIQAGNTYELPWLGKFAHENAVASPHSGDRTVVAGLDDGQNGQVYFYVGDKKATGSDLDQAGLTGGHLFGLKVDELVDEQNPPGTGPAKLNPLGADNQSSFSLVDLGDASTKTGAELDAQSEAAGVTSFFRPEDGAWDTVNHNRFYFVTTASFDQPSRLWAADFTDASHPELGGTIKLLLDGTEGQKMMDNITVNKQGHVVIQEDVGNNPHLGKVWDYDPTHDTMTMIAQHDPARFAPGGSHFLTQDEESSGVIDVTDILGSAGQNAYLLDVQAHYPNGPELVEGGQLLLMHQDLF